MYGVFTNDITGERLVDIALMNCIIGVVIFSVGYRTAKTSDGYIF